MAFKSFRIRRVDLVASPDANPFGSYVRGTDTDAPAGLTRLDSDSALRADGFIAPVGLLDIEAQFQATATTYSSVLLSWSSFLIENPATKSVGDTSIRGVVVVYSKTGAPETVADGVVIKTQNYADITYAVTHNDVLPGAWAYYSLFIHFNQNGVGAAGVNWYEKVATLQELVPFDYQTTDALWSRIPSHHRVSDVNGRNTDPEGLSRGQLYRYLDIFGFEFDRIRTLLNSVVQQYNPEKTETESLDKLAKMFGLEVSIKDLGATRVRGILKDIAYYRQRKGTLEATKQYLIAVAGAEVDIIEATTSPRYKFNIYAEKANLVADSLFAITSGTKKWNISTQDAAVTYTQSNQYITVTNATGATQQFALMSKVAVPVKENTDYWSSVAITGSGTIWSTQWASSSSAWGDWATSNQSNQIIPNNLSPTGRKVILKPTQSTTDMRYPVIIFQLAAGASTVISKWMVEPNTYGDFFNGDSDFGGFVYQNNFADYQWSGSQYASYSTYSTNRKKVIDLIAELLPKLLPVTMLLDTSIDFSINYDWIPGKT